MKTVKKTAKKVVSAFDKETVMQCECGATPKFKTGKCKYCGAKLSTKWEKKRAK